MAIVNLALEEPDLSPRELAVNFTDMIGSFVSEASVYRLLKDHGLITSPAFILMKAADRFADPTTAPNQLWQTDFTYLKVIGWGWFYLSTVLDDFSRYILAWKLCTTMAATDVSDTLQAALQASGLDQVKVLHRPRLLSDSVNLSYFSRTDEWRDFQLMVRKPTNGVLTWHDDAVSEVFNISNGNPYFAKIVCDGVLRNAVAQRDTDITADEVKRATDAEISALGLNSFAHLWQDGNPRPAHEREPDILRRTRVLVAAARCSRQCAPLTIQDILARRASGALTEAEVLAVLHDFEYRNVLQDRDGIFSFVLPIFGMWLVDVGAQQLIADTLNEELATSVLVEENAATVKSEEVVALARKWPTYRGRQIGTDEIRAWYQQVQSQREQRILFTLLQRTGVFGESQIRERLREAFAILKPTLPVPITRSRNDEAIGRCHHLHRWRGKERLSLREPVR